MEQQIRRVGTAFLLGFAVLAFGTGYWQVWRGPALAAAPGNPRVIEIEKRTQRGGIFDRNNEVLVETVDGRRTAHKPALAHATGYYSYRYGATGVERAYDALLGGRQGVPLAQTVARALAGAPRRGGDVQLTIDVKLQEVADRAIGNAQGAVVVLDLETGALLVMLSKPYFDPTTVDDDWSRLSQDEGRPLYNRASQGLYVPGSTFKAVTAAAALEAGIMQPSTQVSDPTGEVTIAGFRITDAAKPPQPAFDFAHAFAWSSNVVFAQVGVQLGDARLRGQAARFGIGKALPFELETSPTSLSRTQPMPPVMLASTAFGQGEMLISPLQMALVAAAIARGGDVPKPYVVAETRASDGKVVYRARPSSLGSAMLPATATALRTMMALAVEEGFSRNAAIPGVRVGGKTGTAQSLPGMPDHSWFIGFAPVEQPRVAVAVIVEYGGWGSLNAAPAARQVLREALRSVGSRQ
ncbi:MAG: cell division protein FtsI [Chloroflexi bacterium]|nr:cell division protein FtsI [Chloroflexota bacterium]